MDNIEPADAIPESAAQKKYCRNYKTKTEPPKPKSPEFIVSIAGQKTILVGFPSPPDSFWLTTCPGTDVPRFFRRGYDTEGNIPTYLEPAHEETMSRFADGSARGARPYA